jgi:tryptophan synthase beta chain
MRDVQFKQRLAALQRDYTGRPSLLYDAKRLTASLGGARILLKREDLNHTGSHKINHCIGHALLAERMMKPRIIAETGAGQHGVATATVAALFGFRCTVYMGAEDVRRQQLNVFRMQLLGAEVRPVESGSKTLKDALNEALRDWVTNCADTYYCLGTVAGPHPYPAIVKEFQAVIGREVAEQTRALVGRAPDVLVACVGGGSNALGLFAPFMDGPTRLIGVEAAGNGLASGRHSASLCVGEPGILHGTKTLVLQNAEGQIAEAHSVAPGLDYPGVGPEHAHLKTSGRAEYVAVDDATAIKGLERLAREEGIICALESAHAVAHAIAIAPNLSKDMVMVVNVSGRGDKDMQALRERHV